MSLLLLLSESGTTSTDVDIALSSGSGLVYDADTSTVGIPPEYTITYQGVRYFEAPQTVSFEWLVEDKDGGNVPVPTGVTISLLDADGSALSPAVTASPSYDSHSVSATSQQVAGILTLPVPPAPSQVYYVQLVLTLDKGDGTGSQTLRARVAIRILA